MGSWSRSLEKSSWRLGNRALKFARRVVPHHYNAGQSLANDSGGWVESSTSTRHPQRTHRSSPLINPKGWSFPENGAASVTCLDSVIADAQLVQNRRDIFISKRGQADQQCYPRHSDRPGFPSVGSWPPLRIRDATSRIRHSR
jgi:hypothetical protein